MKVLFAVNNEEISEAIVKKYQKKYKEIISYKNVYYFNAILKEIQKDKSYDRIVISEDLEQFTNSSYEQMDKFIFERLDSISDEASSSQGSDIPIILICTERRKKSEEILVKLFGIGVYNAIIGNDRSIDEVCRLINKPRLKKEAKTYYQIDSENVSYKAENENDVSEVEIQNILAHFKRLGKNESRYIESYNNIAAQYNDNQLKVISKFLPLGVRAVLEEKSPKYQQVMAFNKAVSDNLRQTKKKDDGLSQKLLVNPKRNKTIEEPIVIPTSMKSAENVKKLTRVTRPKIEKPKEPVEETLEETSADEISFEDIEPVQLPMSEPMSETIPELMEEPEQPKRGRGRPRKNPIVEDGTETKPKRGRGRPRKKPIEPEEIEEDTISLPNIDDYSQTTLPGILDDQNNEEEFDYREQNIELPKYDEPEELDIEDDFEDEEDIEEIIPIAPQPIAPIQENTHTQESINNNYSYSGDVHVDISDALLGNKKIAAFVGTSKNGTSFIVNNLAELLSSTGINVAILDTTKNRNSYYIYTKNEEDLRRTAMSSISNLANGIASGIRVNSNLAVYTSLPNEDTGIENVQTILETLAKSHTVVLIDCDFWTPKGYFSAAQEIYLVQTMDVLTIQPLTAFLKDLVALNILDEQKIRVVINKYVKIRGITEKEIIGGMAYYNDPAMTYQTGLFDKATAKYITIPFEEETYTKYLQGLINCEISLKGYSKIFLQNLRQLGNMIYPSASGKGNYRPPALGNPGGTNFSSSMNNTLDQMKRNY
ncbi:MAG: hypothetical protein IKF17_05100 [Clostridia bacterium]|nr:hypothetical protein [Clostridia bacterium]